MARARTSVSGKVSRDLDLVAYDSRNAGSPLSASEVGVVTPAQAYASAVKTGEIHDRALYYTIERRQPERERKADLQFAPSHPGDPGSPERGLSFAQRLYAGALGNKSSTLPSSNIPVIPPIKRAPSSALPQSAGNQASCGVPHRQTSLSTSLFDTSSEVFNPSDLYHSSVATRGFPLRGSTSPERSATRPPSLLPVLQIPNSLPVTRLSYLANPRASYSSTQNFTLQPEVQIIRPALHQSQAVSTGAQSYSTSVASIHEALGLQGASVETHQDFHPPAIAGGATPSPSPLEQQLVIPPAFSLPPYEPVSNVAEEVLADVAPVVIQPHAAVPHEYGLHDSSLQPPPETNHEAAPSYSLVDEQLPPPAFDDLQATSTTEASAERSPVVHPETLPQEVIETPSPPSPPPSQPPPPFSHGSTAYAPGNAPARALLDKTSYSVGTGREILQDAEILFSSITTGRPGSSSSDPPSVAPIDFQWPNQPPSMSPPVSPSGAVPYNGTVIPSMMPLLPSNSRPVSVVLSSHSRSGFRPPQGSNAVGQGRRDSRPLVNVAEDNDAIDALTRSMSDMMGGPSSDAHSLAYENLSSGRQDIHGTSLGNQRNIPIIPASHPSGTPRTIGSLNQGTSGPEAQRLIQEAYQRPTHAETGRRMGYGIQGLGSANPLVVTDILSSQHLSRTAPSPSPIPLAYSHDELQTESIRIAGGGLIVSQFGETVALSSSRSSYSDRPYIASALPSPPSPYPLQPSHHSIDLDVHGPVAFPGSVPLQYQNIHSLEKLSPMKHGGHVFPLPSPPPIVLQPWNVSQTPQTSSYSQDSAKDQFGPSAKAPALNSNDLARKFAHDALLAPSGAPAYAFCGTNQR